MPQLRQYVAGTLTPQDQHKVEKEALQNQQVDDTLEGLQAMKNAGVDESAALLDVRRRLQQRISPQKRRLVPYYYASAAAVVMAVGLGWWLVQRQDLPESTAKTTAETVLPSAPVPESAPILEDNSPTLSAKPKTKTLAQKPVQEQVAAAPPTQEMLEAAPAEGSAASIVAEKKADEIAAVPAQELAAQLAQAKSRVASAPAAALPVDTFTLRGNILDAKTAQTQKAYSDYVRQAVQTFLEKNPQGPRGRVVIEFTVNELGELSEFENKNRANNQLFEEAVRILKQGEKWTPTYKKGKPQSERKRQVFQF